MAGRDEDLAPEPRQRSVSSLEMNLGQVLTALGPLALFAWQIMTWMGTLEADLRVANTRIYALEQREKARSDEMRQIEAGRLDSLERRIVKMLKEAEER